jgi:hypothetical protein
LWRTDLEAPFRHLRRHTPAPGDALFRVHSESDLMELQRCRVALGQAKSWTVQVVSRPVSANFATLTNRTKVSCPDDYEVSFRSRTPDDVIAEQSTIHTQGVTYVENVQGTWEKSTTATDPPTLKECGKGPGVGCQEWHVEYGNEWPQVAPYTICIDPKTHLPGESRLLSQARRMTLRVGIARRLSRRRLELSAEIDFLMNL